MKKKIVIILSTLILSLTFVTSLVVAYLVNISSKDNVLSKPTPKVSIVEDLGNEKIVAIKNDSNFKVYVRVYFVVVYRDINNSQNIIPAKDDVLYTLDLNWSNNWTLDGDYFYYNELLAPEEVTSDLLNNVILKSGVTVPEGYQLEVSVMADSIQGEPIDGVIESWGFAP